MVGALDIGFVPGAGGLDAAAMLKGGVDVLFNLGADEIDIPAGAFVIYQGTHGDRGAQRADVILPAAAYTEKSATYVNTEGRPQMTARAVFPPGEAKEDWAILRALSDVLGQKLPFDSLSQLRAALYAAHPHLAALDTVTTADPAGVAALARGSAKPGKAPFAGTVTDFYLTNPIARASAVMAECSALTQRKLPLAAE
jgi:NADH-quinone oxidoreductase subunit G